MLTKREKANKAYKNYCYWLDYVGPGGVVYNTQISQSYAQWIELEKECSV